MAEMSDQEKEFLAQQELQREHFEQQVAMSDPYIKQQQAEIQSSIIKAINPKDVLDELEMTLRGQIYDGEGSIIQKFKPLMNDLGVSTMIGFARTCLNQSIVISHFESNHVKQIMDCLSRDIILSLQLNWRMFEIAPISNIDLINDLVLIACFGALRRATGGGERSWLKSTMQENLSGKLQNPFIKKEGFFSKFKL